MASKFMVNAAFKARILLRPSHQRTILFGTVNKLECLIPSRPTLPPILSSRSYSDSTSTLTPPFPKSSGSTEGSQSSGPEDKTYSDSASTPPFSKSSGPTEGSQSSGPEDKNWFHPKVWGGAAVITVVGTSVAGYFTRDWYKAYRRRVRESTVYDKLKKGPVFQEAIEHTIPRKPLVEKIRQLTTPVEDGSSYPLIIGEHGTGKTSLITLAVNGMDEPKGVVYVDIPRKCDSAVDVTKAMREAMGWSPEKFIDFSESAYLEETLTETLKLFSRFAKKYKQEYKRAPVLIIDNANRLAQGLLDTFQDYAKNATDNDIATVVFVSNEYRVLRRMMGDRSCWSRSGEIIEINDVSKEEALQYLKLRKVDEEQAAQIYELAGGRMRHLKYMADKIERKGVFEAIRQEMFSNTKEQLRSAEILPGHRHHKDGAKIVRELLKKGSISQRILYSLVGKDTGDKLLEKPIFAFHFGSGEITFQSTVVKRFCEENSALWEGK